MIKVTVKENLKPLQDLARRARELDERRNVALSKLLTPEFLSRCSRFRSFQEMLDYSGFRVESAQDFKAIPDVEWDAFIRNNTSYSTWEEMLSEATGELVKRQLGL